MQSFKSSLVVKAFLRWVYQKFWCAIIYSGDHYADRVDWLVYFKNVIILSDHLNLTGCLIFLILDDIYIFVVDLLDFETSSVYQVSTDEV
jgi:hypothetical protein